MQHVSTVHQTESAAVFGIEKPADTVVARFGEVFLFLAFLALGCKGTFIGGLYQICCNSKESRENFLSVSKESDTYRNGDIFPLVCVFDFVFEELECCSREQKREKSVPQCLS